MSKNNENKNNLNNNLHSHKTNVAFSYLLVILSLLFIIFSFLFDLIAVDEKDPEVSLGYREITLAIGILGYYCLQKGIKINNNIGKWFSLFLVISASLFAVMGFILLIFHSIFTIIHAIFLGWLTYLCLRSSN